MSKIIFIQGKCCWKLYFAKRSVWSQDVILELNYKDNKIFEIYRFKIWDNAHTKNKTTAQMFNMQLL